jgi:hypothetical protein
MDELPKGVHVKFMGGLGNQMFMVAAAYIAGKYHMCPVYLSPNPIPNNPHNTSQQDYRKTIFRKLGTSVDQVPHGYHDDPGGKKSGFLPWDPASLVPGTHITSYHQYYPPLAPYENELRSAFLEGLAEARARMAAKYMCDGAAFLHVRRGDYVGKEDIHYSQPGEYYAEAMRRIGNVDRIYILSDDINFVKNQSLFRSSPNLVCIDEANELDGLALMTLCTAGAICANSTFSWWGAFLGAYGQRAPICVPKKWIRDSIVSLFPPEWIVLGQEEWSAPVEAENTAFTTITDASYYPKAQKTIQELRTKGRWAGDIVLMTIDFDADAAFLEKWRIIPHRVAHIDTSILVAKLKQNPIKSMADNRHFGKLYQWDKLYCFSDYFLKWERVVFLDAGIRVFDTVQSLLDLEWKNSIRAHDDSGRGDDDKNGITFDTGRRFQCQMDWDASPEITEDIFTEFSRDICNENYMLNCMFVYDTAIIHKASKDTLVEAMNRWPISLCNEMGIMNLYYAFKHRLWKPFPIYTGSKMLFGWSEQCYPNTLNWNSFHFLKYSTTA